MADLKALDDRFQGLVAGPMFGQLWRPQWSRNGLALGRNLPHPPNRSRRCGRPEQAVDLRRFKSWPDNANLDKARRLPVAPIKIEIWGRKILHGPT